jgi:chemotaxis protein methyltransferase CheR
MTRGPTTVLAPAAPPELGALSRATGLNLAAYRAEHVTERIRRALDREAIADLPGLVRLLMADAAARSRFRRSVAISVTGLFRDPGQFELLERELLPALLAEERRLTAWSAGCANGSELYSVATVLERLGALEGSRLLGSDVLEENLTAARHGIYGDVHVAERLRARVRWEQRDVTLDGAPPGRWRLVLCRNLAIYLAPPARRDLHRLLAGSLAPGGLLMLGRSERIAECGALGLERRAPHVYRRTT